MADGRKVLVANDNDIVQARHEGRKLATDLGFSSTDTVLIITAISELARNIVLYAKHGEIILTPNHHEGRQGLTIVARDEGPGIPDLNKAMQDGYSTSNGLGFGLPGVRRLMDEFNIESAPGKGTVVTVRKWKT
ncbi:MAG: anti-sigma regulatory factor [Chloroflexi bacterium]|nr:anti-sigma regulatory factor [Chloroflexota bacterium]